MSVPQPAPASPMPTHTWIFPARAVNVVDGDTIDVLMDLGRHTYSKDRLRLINVNAPERKDATLPAGNASRDYVAKWLSMTVTTLYGLPIVISSDWPLLVQTFKTDVFGRYLALVWRIRDGACLNNDLVRDGMARVDIR